MENKINRKIYNVFVLFYLLYIFFVLIFSIKISSLYYSFTNKSSSMYPLIDTGSMTIVKDFGYNNYNKGDIIAFYSSLGDNKYEIITHRISDISGNVYVTKGDANEGIDRKIVIPRLVIGKVIFVVPLIGYVITFAKSGVGLVLTVYLPAIFIVIVELGKIIKMRGNVL